VQFGAEDQKALFPVFEELLVMFCEMPAAPLPSGLTTSADDGERAQSSSGRSAEEPSGGAEKAAVGAHSANWHYRAEAASCILTVMFLTPPPEMVGFLVGGVSGGAKGRLLLFFRTLETLISQNPYPPHWFVMSALCFATIIRCLRLSTAPLRDIFLSGGRFDRDLWETFLRLCIDFMNSPLLQQSEKTSMSKQSALQSRLSSMRSDLSVLLSSEWEALAQFQMHFIPSMVEPILGLVKLPGREVHETSLNIYASMMSREVRATGSFTEVEGKTVEVLDSFVSDNVFGPDARELFVKSLEKRVVASDSLRESGQRFVAEIRQVDLRLLSLSQSLTLSFSLFCRSLSLCRQSVVRCLHCDSSDVSSLPSHSSSETSR
jgi:hypothetical protein